MSKLYTLYVSKNIPNIFDCNLKKNYQIVIIFGVNIPDTTYNQLTIYFSRHLMSASALTVEIRPSEICVEIYKKREKKSLALSIITWRKIIRF